MLDQTVLIVSGLFIQNYWYYAVPQYLRQAEKLLNRFKGPFCSTAGQKGKAAQEDKPLLQSDALALTPSSSNKAIRLLKNKVRGGSYSEERLPALCCVALQVFSTQQIDHR